MICKKCGFCCVAGSEYYLCLTEQDYTRLVKNGINSKHILEIGYLDCILKNISTEFTYRITLIELKDGSFRCPFLRGRVGHKCYCSIYDYRPSCCRDFTVGCASFCKGVL